jgi:hypothetical protein
MEMKLLWSMSIAVLVAAAPASQAADKSNGGYLTDKAGNIVTIKSSGHCIRTKEWTKETADAACLAKASTK